MGRKARYTDEEFIEAVKTSTSRRQVLEKLGLKETGGNYANILNKIERFELDTTHFTGTSWGKGKTVLDDPRIGGLGRDEIFTENSKANSSYVRSLIVKYNLLEYKCQLCGIEPFWNEKKLNLQLDHISGERADQRLENLRWLCPNCHSQTETYGSKNSKKKRVSDEELIEVLKTSQSVGEALRKVELFNGRNYARAYRLIIEHEIEMELPEDVKVVYVERKTSTVTEKKPKPSELDPNWRRKPKPHTCKVIWPTDSQLKENVLSYGYEKVGRDLGVSGNAVKKRLKVLGIVIPKYHTQNNLYKSDA